MRERKRVVVDAAGYRERRRETLEGRADRAAEQALTNNRVVEMDPMSAQERRVVHERLDGRLVRDASFLRAHEIAISTTRLLVEPARRRGRPGARGSRAMLRFGRGHRATTGFRSRMPRKAAW